MTGADLALAYPRKARLRMEVLVLLAARQGWSDLVREAQELVELASKALLRQVGVDPPPSMTWARCCWRSGSSPAGDGWTSRHRRIN